MSKKQTTLVLIDRLVRSWLLNKHDKGYFRSTLDPECDLKEELSSLTNNELKTVKFLMGQLAASSFSQGCAHARQRSK